LENMTAASSAVEEYVPRFNTFLWFTTRGNGVTAQQLIDVLTDDTHRNEWYDVCSLMPLPCVVADADVCVRFVGMIE